MNRAPVCYEYDGTFSGFLTCVFESYAYREEPVCFLSPGDGRTTLWDTRRVDADQALARRVWRGIRQNISPGAGRLASRAFLTCLEEREIHIWRFLEYGFRRGSSVTADLGDDRVDVLRRAVQHLEEVPISTPALSAFPTRAGCWCQRSSRKTGCSPCCVSILPSGSIPRPLSSLTAPTGKAWFTRADGGPFCLWRTSIPAQPRTGSYTIAACGGGSSRPSASRGGPTPAVRTPTCPSATGL